MDAKLKIEKSIEFLHLYYEAKILEAIRKGQRVFQIDFRELTKFDIELSEYLINDPDETIKSVEIALQSFDMSSDKREFRARIYNIPNSQKFMIRDIRSDHIDKLICIDAVIRTKSSVRPVITRSIHECPSCGNEMFLLQNEEIFKEPARCACNYKGKFRCKRKEKVDVQYFTIEEDISEIGNDSVPSKIKIVLKEDLTHCDVNIDLLPPRAIRIVGIVRESQITTKHGLVSNKLDMYVDVNSFELIEDSLDRLEFSEEDVKQFKELANDPELLKKMINSVAPQIYGHEIVKEGVLLFLVKGVKKESDDATQKARDFFHILLVGDPGTGKSEFGNDICKLSYKCRRAVGKGSSGVGLTASAERDEILGERILTAGLIPMCNEGHAVIDEFDKLDGDVESHLLSCMEDGVIEINKSRVSGRLKANVGLFMIANPKNMKFEFYSPLLNQINLSEMIRSRFDLIFPIIDSKDPVEQENRFNKIFEKNLDINKATKREIDFDLLRKYICYVSKNMKPTWSGEAIKEAKVFKTMMNSSKNENDIEMLSDKKSRKLLTAVNITGRQQTTPVRLSEAYAKLRMSKTVNVQDVQRAARMIEYYFNCFAFDKETGRIDANILNIGKTENQLDRENIVRTIIFNTVEITNKPVSVNDIYDAARLKGINDTQIDTTLEELKQKGDIVESRSGFINKL